MNIKLHIERLVLDGLPVEQRHGAELQAAVETELTRLLTDDGLSSSLKPGAAIARVKAAAIQIRSGDKITGLGQQIARSVYGGIRNE